jgi:hypothetical protein
MIKKRAAEKSVLGLSSFLSFPTHCLLTMTLRVGTLYERPNISKMVSFPECTQSSKDQTANLSLPRRPNLRDLEMNLGVNGQELN